MKQLTKEQIENKGLQTKLQFGTRVEARGIRGIVNHCSKLMCRVYHGVGKYIEVNPKECKILSVEEAVGV